MRGPGELPKQYPLEMVSFNLTRLPSKLEGNRLYYMRFALLAQEEY
jgi:hypothetical protein